MRFKVDVECRASSLLSGRFEGENLSMLHAGVGVSSGANHLAVSVRNYRAHMGIRRRQSKALARQFEGMLKMLFVGGVSGHSR